MQMPEFPCIKVHFSEQRSDIVKEFLSIREDDRWLIIADHAAQTQNQLWTAWLLTVRGFSNGNALARSHDAEFLRYIAGTHHVSDAFSKAGIQDGNQYAWLLFLPDLQSVGGSFYPIYDVEKFREKALLITESMNILQLEDKPKINIDGLLKLGLQVGDSNVNLEDSLIGHIVSANFNS